MTVGNTLFEYLFRLTFWSSISLVKNAVLFYGRKTRKFAPFSISANKEIVRQKKRSMTPGNAKTVSFYPFKTCRSRCIDTRGKVLWNFKLKTAIRPVGTSSRRIVSSNFHHGLIFIFYIKTICQQFPTVFPRR